MIGPSSGTSSTSAENDHHGVMHTGKRRALEELDIESICDEVCGHHHRSAIKRPRFLADGSATTLHFDHEDVLQNHQDTIYDAFDGIYDHYHHGHQIGVDGPVTRLEVLVVDDTWDEELENFEAAATAQPCSTALTELTSPTHHEHTLQQQQHQQQQELQQQHQQQQQELQQQQNEAIQNLQNVDFQNAFWSQNQPQTQQTTTMPKIQNNDNGRSRSSVGTGNFGLAHHNTTQASTYEDQENGNLSWLLDFKLDSLIEAPEDRSTALLPQELSANKNKFNGNNNNNNRTTNTFSHDSAKRPCNYEASVAYSPSSYGLAENRNRCTGPKKPPYTYTELIEHALQERGELTVSAIYQWISEHFPYYKSNDDRWKNSVRHNLSINPHFRKGSKAPHGAGHLWAIASQDESKSRQFFNIASIRQALKNEEANATKANSRTVAIDEVAAATASISQPVEEENIVDSITLEHCAEQILSGIKKEVEVQYLIPMMVSNNGEIIHNQQCQQNGHPDQLCPVKETDFLNPVSKEVVAEECGLIGEGYLVTDLNPSSLGLNMAESEIVTTDNLFGEELSFQFYEFTSPSQLQSA